MEPRKAGDMMKSAELLDCPFCGGEPRYGFSPAENFSRHWIHCTRCEEVFQISRISKDEVIRLWNRREKA